MDLLVPLRQDGIQIQIEAGTRKIADGIVVVVHPCTRAGLVAWLPRGVHDVAGLRLLRLSWLLN